MHHTHHVLLHIRTDNTSASNLHLYGFAEDPASQGLHSSGESSREHDSLTVRPDVVYNAHDLWWENVPC